MSFSLTSDFSRAGVSGEVSSKILGEIQSDTCMFSLSGYRPGAKGVGACFVWFAFLWQNDFEAGL